MKDARVKLAYILILTSLSVLAKDLVFLGGLLISAIIVNLLLGVNLLTPLKGLRHLLSMVIFIAIVQSLTIKGGNPILVIGKITFISEKGLIMSAEFLLRMAIIIFSGLIAQTTKGRELADSLVQLGMPYEIVFMSGIAVRYIPVFREEFRSRLFALELRGVDIKKFSLKKKMKVYGYLISPTISGSLIRSEYLAKSVESRGFRAGKRTMYRVFKMSFTDWIFLIIGLVFFVSFLFLNYYYGPII